MIKTRITNVKSIENEEIIIAVTMTIIIMIIATVIMKIITIRMKTMRIKIGNRLKI